MTTIANIKPKRKKYLLKDCYNKHYTQIKALTRNLNEVCCLGYDCHKNDIYNAGASCRMSWMMGCPCFIRAQASVRLMARVSSQVPVAAANAVA